MSEWAGEIVYEAPVGFCFFCQEPTTEGISFELEERIGHRVLALCSTCRNKLLALLTEEPIR